MYRTGLVVRRFGLKQSVFKTWYKEFHIYLSSFANPQYGEKRRFTFEDIKIIALIWKYQYESCEQIHKRLQNGEKAEPPYNEFALPEELNNKISELESKVEELRSRVIEKEAVVELLIEEYRTLEGLLRDSWRENGRLLSLLPQEESLDT